MDILGIDYGEKYVGLAIAKEEFGIATPYKTIEAQENKEKITRLSQIINQEEVDKIVIGLPLGENREETEMSKTVRSFSDKVQQKTEIDIEFVNEFFTSQEAESLEGGIANNHEKAAMLILDSYLD